MKKISFMHKYHKLNNETFTTIRGKSHFKTYKIGELVEVSVKENLVFAAEITGLELCKLSDMPLDLMKKDGEFPGFSIRSKGDFVGLVNSLRQYHKLQGDAEEMTIIYLRKRCSLTHRYGPEWHPDPNTPIYIGYDPSSGPDSTGWVQNGK